MAAKLLRTGQIAAIKPIKRPTTEGFKRAKTKQLGADKPAGYQSFDSTQSFEDGEPTTPEPISPIAHRPPQYQNSLYDNFVTAKEVEVIAREETNRDRRRDGKAHYVNRDVPNQGNTVYVKGTGVNEQLLKQAFASWTIVHINVEAEKNTGFVTFDNIAEANEAITKMNNTTISNVELHVSLARRQPHKGRAANDKSSQDALKSWAASTDAKRASESDSTKKDPRPKVKYDEDLF